MARNPVAARLCRRPQEWPLSSAAAQIRCRGDGPVEVEPMLSRVAEWAGYLSDAGGDGTSAHYLEYSRTGRPLGDEVFVLTLERISGRKSARRSPGQKKKAEEK